MENIHGKLTSFIMINGSILVIFIAILLINMPIAYSAPPDAEMSAFLHKFHGHTCPGSLMGLRLGLAAKEALNAQGKITARTFPHACPVDGIQVATGATYGNRAITLEEGNGMYLILTDTKTGKRVEATLTQEAMEKGGGFREFSSKARSLEAGSPEQLEAKKKADDILNWFRTAPDENVVAIKVLK